MAVTLRNGGLLNGMIAVDNPSASPERFEVRGTTSGWHWLSAAQLLAFSFVISTQQFGPQKITDLVLFEVFFAGFYGMFVESQLQPSSLVTIDRNQVTVTSISGKTAYALSDLYAIVTHLVPQRGQFLTFYLYSGKCLRATTIHLRYRNRAELYGQVLKPLRQVLKEHESTRNDALATVDSFQGIYRDSVQQPENTRVAEL